MYNTAYGLSNFSQAMPHYAKANAGANFVLAVKFVDFMINEVKNHPQLAIL